MRNIDTDIRAKGLRPAFGGVDGVQFLVSYDATSTSPPV